MFSRWLTQLPRRLIQSEMLRVECLEDRRVLANITFELAENFPDGSSFSTGFAWGDLNGDGIEDLAVSGNREFSTVILGNGSGTFGDPIPLPVKSGRIAIEDLDRDGDLDLVARNLLYVGQQEEAGHLAVFLNKGGGTFADPHIVDPGGPDDVFDRLPLSSLVIADLNGDTHFDLAVSDWDGFVSVLLGNGEGAFADADHFDAGASPRNLAVEDLDGDGDLDLALANQNSLEFSVLINRGDATFDTPVAYPILADPARVVAPRTAAVAIEDVNNDGHPDVAVHWEENCCEDAFGGIVVFRGRGDGAFVHDGDYEVDYHPSPFVLEDFNADGVLDLVAADRHTRIVLVWVGNTGGSFEAEPTSFHAPDEWIVRLASVDFDRDGLMDLAIKHLSTVSILLNSSEPIPQTPPPGDANMDGAFDQLDIVQVLQAGKYLTVRSATFEEGDWSGDGVFDQLDVIIALASSTYMPG